MEQGVYGGCPLCPLYPLLVKTSPRSNLQSRARFFRKYPTGFNRCLMTQSLDLTQQRNVSQTRRWILQRTNNTCAGVARIFLRGMHNSPNAPAFPSLHMSPNLTLPYTLAVLLYMKWRNEVICKIFVSFLDLLTEGRQSLQIKYSRCVNPKNDNKKRPGLVKSPNSSFPPLII